MWRKAAIAIPFLLITTSVLAQADCPAIVQQALEAADSACSETNRNQACYGNISAEAEPQPDAENFTFEKSGDIVNVVDLQTLTLEALDTTQETWGVAVMKLQANLPDTLPGQNVMFLLFGDVEIENAVVPSPQPVLLEVTAANNPNVRGGPSVNNTVVGSLSTGQVVTADGRNDAGDWLHIQFEDESGWVFADLVTVDGDVNSLLVMEAGDNTPPLKPMQAFYFRSGVSDSPCAEAPDSGILIQTPDGAGEVALTVNGVDIRLGSTAYLQAQPSGTMNVTLVEGGAQVTAEGETQIVPAGTHVTIPMDENLEPSGPPSEPEPYDNENLNVLPIGNLEREIEIAPALTQAEIDALSSLTPVSGNWLYQVGQISLSGACPEGLAEIMAGAQSAEAVTLNITDEFSFSAIWGAAGQGFPGGASISSNPETGFYTLDYTEQGSSIHWELQFLSSTEADGYISVSFEGCNIFWPIMMDAQ